MQIFMPPNCWFQLRSSSADCTATGPDLRWGRHSDLRGQGQGHRGYTFDRYVVQRRKEAPWEQGQWVEMRFSDKFYLNRLQIYFAFLWPLDSKNDLMNVPSLSWGGRALDFFSGMETLWFYSFHVKNNIVSWPNTEEPELCASAITKCLQPHIPDSLLYISCCVKLPARKTQVLWAMHLLPFDKDKNRKKGIDENFSEVVSWRKVLSIIHLFVSFNRRMFSKAKN